MRIVESPTWCKSGVDCKFCEHLADAISSGARTHEPCDIDAANVTLLREHMPGMSAKTRARAMTTIRNLARKNGRHPSELGT